jgi:hypothetical protein
MRLLPAAPTEDLPMPKITELRPEAPWVEMQSEPQDWDGIGATELLRMHYHLHVIRAFEETVLEFEKLGLAHGPVHSSIGQEAGAVGAMALLNSGDMITGAHRGHHQFVAKAMRHLDDPRHDPRKEPLPEPITTMLYRTLAEILGLADGFCKGRGGSMHLRWTECGAMGTNAIVGGGVPIANGLAWAKKREGKGHVAMTFFGDGSAHIGSVPESRGRRVPGAVRRRGDGGQLPAGGRIHVRRLHAGRGRPGLQPDRQEPPHVRRRLGHAAGAVHQVRDRHWLRPATLDGPGGLIFAVAWVAHRRAEHTVRLRGPDEQRLALRGPGAGHVHGAQQLLHGMTWMPEWPTDDRRSRIVFITLASAADEVGELFEWVRRMAR